MKTTVEALDDNRVKLSVEVEAKEFEIEVEKAFKKIGREIRLPGFRKGKVPRKVIEARFGSGMARGQALEDSIPEYFLAALNDLEVDIISPPQYEVVSGLEEGDLAFDAVVQVRPDVEIAGYEAITVEIPSHAPSDDEIEDRINAFLRQFAELRPVDRVAAPGDTATIDIGTRYNGEELEGLTASDYSYRVGSGGVVPELDEHLTGAGVGDVVEFSADHPDPAEDGQLAFRVEIKLIQEQVLPELTDEIVANGSDFATAAAFRDDVREQLTRRKAAQADSAWRDKAADALGALVLIEPPVALVDTEVRNRIEDMARRLQASGIGFQTYLQMLGQSVEDLFGQMRAPAIEAVKIDMALRALAGAEGLTATDDDVDNEFTELSAGTGVPVEQLRAQISTKNQLMMLRADISKRKAVEWLLERVVVLDEHGNTVDKEALELAAASPDDDHDHDHDDDDHDHDHDGEEE